MKTTINHVKIFCICLFTSIATSQTALKAQTPPSYVPTDGLVGWWPFNGNANDESGNGNNGTVNGATLTEDRFGGCNKAYEFDGMNDYIEVQNSSDFNLPNFSISIWIQNNSLATDTPTFIINKGCIPDGVFTSTEMSFRIYAHDANGQYISDIWCPNRSFLAGPSYNSNWFHLSMTYDGTTMSLYVDGVLVESISQTGQLSNNEYSMLIGARNFLDCALDSYFDGRLDDIGIWNRALTQEEITDLYNANLCYEYITVTDTLIINLPTGFNPVTYSNTILMYPNPSNEQLTIDYGDYATLAGYTLKIFNSIGQEIHSANINQQQEVLPLGTWGGAGNYQVVIYNVQGVPVDTRTIVLQE